MGTYDNEIETKEIQIYTKDYIKAKHIFFGTTLLPFVFFFVNL